MAKRGRKTASLKYELDLYKQGYRYIAGLDEAGRGAWAGPVSAAAVILPLDRDDLTEVLAGVTDSKRLTPEQREALVPLIQEVAVCWGIGRATSDEIDDKGIIRATKLAMERALRKCQVEADFLIVDALELPKKLMPPERQLSLIRGDSKSLSIAAASILAKVYRDRFMVAIDEQYPEYGFAQHKGYGTREHQEKLTANGPCHAHRFSFKPIMQWQRMM